MEATGDVASPQTANDLNNLQTLCLRCNTSKGNRL